MTLSWGEYSFLFEVYEILYSQCTGSTGLKSGQSGCQAEICDVSVAPVDPEVTDLCRPGLESEKVAKDNLHALTAPISELHWAA